MKSFFSAACHHTHSPQFSFILSYKIWHFQTDYQRIRNQVKHPWDLARDSVRFLHIIIFRVRNPRLTDSSFRINICDVRDKRQKPGTSLPAGEFSPLIPAQTCVKSYFPKKNGQITIFSEYDPFERRSLYVYFSPVHPAHDRMADDTSGALFCLPHSADRLWGRTCVLFCTGFR